MRGHADNYHLDAAELAAVIYVESRFRPQIRSGAGAVGLMQVLPETAQGIADRTGGEGFVEDDLYDPEINVRYGAWYLGHLRQKYRGRPNAAELALAAYNAGQGTVDGWIASTPPGEPVRIGYSETRAYLDRDRAMRAASTGGRTPTSSGSYAAGRPREPALQPMIRSSLTPRPEAQHARRAR